MRFLCQMQKWSGKSFIYTFNVSINIICNSTLYIHIYIWKIEMREKFIFCMCQYLYHILYLEYFVIWNGHQYPGNIIILTLKLKIRKFVTKGIRHWTNSGQCLTQPLWVFAYWSTKINHTSTVTVWKRKKKKKKKRSLSWLV